MCTTEIMIELPKLSRVEQRAILNRLIELDEDAEVLDEARARIPTLRCASSRIDRGIGAWYLRRASC